MAIHWQIPFVSLRTATTYTVNIYDANYSGAPVVLKGGAIPFETQEDDDDDMFANVRTQSGYLRIVDDGKDASGSTLASGNTWRNIIPQKDTDRPVTLTAGGSVVWQGYIQTQNYGSTLYGGVQEREFPLQCPLSVLQGIHAVTNITELKNFAFLLKHILDNSGMTFTTIKAQGGSYAQSWLLTKFDWHNFYNVNDDGIDSKYDLLSILQDMCKFWGWTARTKGQTLYLTCADDSTLTTWLTMTSAQLTTMAGGSTAGTTTDTFVTETIAGDEFASIDNDDFAQRGPSKASVKADVNPADTVIKFAPADVEKIMDDAGSYTWVQGSGDLVGYFTTPPILSFTGSTLAGQGYGSTASESSLYGGFCRRQIYTSPESEEATKMDMILVHRYYNEYDSNALVSLRTTRPMIFSGGSLSISGQMFRGSEVFERDGNDNFVRVRLGIGPNADRTGAKWFYLILELGPGPSITWLVNHGWSSTVQECKVHITGNSMNEFGFASALILQGALYTTKTIPVDDNMFGFLFLDIMGLTAHDNYISYEAPDDPFEIGNLTVTYSRETTILSSSTSEVRPRTLTVERKDTAEYTQTINDNGAGNWNADCIFATDNNLEYGYGLLVSSAGSYLQNSPYPNGNEKAEQHLVNRVAAYWATNKRMIRADFQTNEIADITPQYKVSIDGATMYPISINRNWRDDITTLTMLQI